jgi:hypothetical protein
MTSHPLKTLRLTSVARGSVSPQADSRRYKGELHGVDSAEWDMESESVAMATKGQGVEVLCSWDGYEVVRDPVYHH